MTEISFITQNGEQINLKDAKGREMLAEKQKKLIAGKGISISEDGVISANGTSLFKELVVKDCAESNWCGNDYVFDMHLQYIGNPALVKKQIMNHECSSYTQAFMDNGNIPRFVLFHDGGQSHKQEVYDALSALPDTGENYLIVVGLYGEITETNSTENDGSHGYAVGDKYFFDTNGGEYRASSFALVNTASYSNEEKEVFLYSESSDSAYYWNTVKAPSVLKIIAMVSAGLNVDNFGWRG